MLSKQPAWQVIGRAPACSDAGPALLQTASLFRFVFGTWKGGIGPDCMLNCSAKDTNDLISYTQFDIRTSLRTPPREKVKTVPYIEIEPTLKVDTDHSMS